MATGVNRLARRIALGENRAQRKEVNLMSIFPVVRDGSHHWF
jgi:hypothetical protein